MNGKLSKRLALESDASDYVPTLRPEHKRVLRIGLLITTLVALLAAGLLMRLGEKGRPAPPQHDVLMYMQYARAMAEGRPYEYQRGDPPSTGSTSHLYPAVLAVFYKLGFRGENLLYASLLMNAAYYVIAVGLVGLLAAALLPHLLGLAIALSIFSGPLFLSVLGQTDMGLFVVCTLGVWAAALYRRPLTAIALITAAVWTRPEGALVAVALLFGGGLGVVRERRLLTWCGIGLWGLAQFGLVLAWNHWIAGSPAFHSLISKGHWIWHPPGGAFKRTARDLAHLIIGLWFSAPTARYFFRSLYSFPIIAGISAAAGWIRLLKDESSFRKAIAWGWFAMIGGGLLATAASGWQGFFYDRHAAWMLPFIIVLTAGGVNGFYERRLRSPRESRVPLLALLLIAYAVVVFPAFFDAMCSSAWTTQAQIRFAKDVVSAMAPSDSRIGALNYPGLAYVLPSRKFVHLGGYVSPRFASARDFIANLEVLKHEPKHRFDFWLLAEAERRHPTLNSVVGTLLASETEVFPTDIRLSLLRADFSSLDAAGLPISDVVRVPLQGMTPADRLDIGYDADELAHAYNIVDRNPRRRFQPGFATAMIAGRAVGDVGRIVMGEESFRFRTRAGQPARLIWRNGGILTVNARYDDREFPFQTVNLGTNRTWRVFVNDRLVNTGSGTPGAVFEECIVDLSAETITSDEIRIRVEGDVVSFAWWLYQ